MNFSVSDTAEYGGYTRGPRIVTKQTRKEMKKILTEIQTGKFAKEWINETFGNKQKKFLKMRKEMNNHLVEKVGSKLRGMMSWLKK